jgi:hypothetical protein
MAWPSPGEAFRYAACFFEIGDPVCHLEARMKADIGLIGLDWLRFSSNGLRIDGSRGGNGFC